jgi:hypothetical protein
MLASDSCCGLEEEASTGIPGGRLLFAAGLHEWDCMRRFSNAATLLQ